MATGVLVLGVERATRLLGRLALTEKAYDATIRLGESTVSDDATSDVTARASAAGVTDEALRTAVADLTGTIMQVPSSVSAVKVSGRRAYKQVRAGKEVNLEPREVTVRTFEIVDVRRHGDLVDIDAHIECSSGTYVRALARDLGAALKVGGHLTMLRRTRVGSYDLEQAATIEELERDFSIIPIAEVAARNFPRLTVDRDTARLVAYGQKLPSIRVGAGPVALFDPDGEFLALYEDSPEGARAVAVFTS